MKIKKIKWRKEYSVRMPFCPYCFEPAYEADRCVFCEKPYKWVKEKWWRRDCLVDVGEFRVVQCSNHHIHIYKDGEMVYHAQCTQRRSKRSLRKMVDEYFEICSLTDKILEGDRCVVCGENVPEGRQVCGMCEVGQRFMNNRKGDDVG